MRRGFFIYLFHALGPVYIPCSKFNLYGLLIKGILRKHALSISIISLSFRSKVRHMTYFVSIISFSLSAWRHFELLFNKNVTVVKTLAEDKLGFRREHPFLIKLV